ncbi:MAG: medium chain dehydrogenase/reductase family protein [Candidatus Kapabacteria bacterium]|nr:medium chain dehydrogenase/reductase family protein [Candidatus Kapabacteria bacterium]
MPFQRSAYRMTRAGSLHNLHLVQETLPDPHEYEVVVEVRAIGLNFADIFAMMGLYSATPKGSFIPGLEFAGIVRSVGNKVSRVAVGERVLGAIRFGAYATHVSVREDYVQPLPADWTFEEGAAFLVQALTAYYALVPLGALRKGSAVLIHSAAGGVGIVANRIAKRLGAFSIGSVGAASKIEALKDEGYDRLFVRSGTSYQASMRDLKEALGERPLTLVLDSLGGEALKASYDALAPSGRIVCFGSASMAFQGKRPPYLSLAWKWLRRPRFDALSMIEQNKAVLGFNLIWLWENIDQMREMLDAIAAMHLPKPLVGHTFPFQALPEAITTFQSGMTIGKVVVSVS